MVLSYCSQPHFLQLQCAVRQLAMLTPQKYIFVTATIQRTACIVIYIPKQRGDTHVNYPMAKSRPGSLLACDLAAGQHLSKDLSCGRLYADLFLRLKHVWMCRQKKDARIIFFVHRGMMSHIQQMHPQSLRAEKRLISHSKDSTIVYKPLKHQFFIICPFYYTIHQRPTGRFWT